MLPSSGFLGRGYSTAQDEAQVRSNYQKLVDKGKIESIGPADEIIVMKHPIENSAGEITNYQWRIFPSDVTNTSGYSQKDSERTCNQALQEKEDELRELNSKYNKDIDFLTEQNRMQAEGITPKQNVVEILKDSEELENIKARTNPSNNSEKNFETEGGRRKTKKHRKKRKGSRKKYTKRRKYSRRPK
jgi:hypothetical protein